MTAASPLMRGPSSLSQLQRTLSLADLHRRASISSRNAKALLFQRQRCLPLAFNGAATNCGTTCHRASCAARIIDTLAPAPMNWSSSCDTDR